MRVAVVAVALLACAGAADHGQQPSVKAHTETFHWNANASQESTSETALSQSKTLGPSERKALINSIAGLLKHDKGVSNTPTHEELRTIAAGTRVKLIDLNGDGVPEVIAQPVGDDSGCSPTGNCPFWVFIRSGAGYKLILDGHVTQTFAVQSTRTNGFYDLVLAMHGSAFDSQLYLYRFAGGLYRRGPCYSADWVVMNGDERKELKEPLITPCRFGGHKVK